MVGKLAKGKSIVVVNGSPRTASRTGHLLDWVAAAVARRIEGHVSRIDLSRSGPLLLSSLSREGLPVEGKAVLRQIEAADLLIAGTPVYRASYTGAFKYVFDLVDRDALGGKVVLLAVTGGTPLHGLVGEHQLRPLFGFFRAITVPTAIFATESEIDVAQVSNSLAERIDQAAGEAERLLSATVAHARNPERALAANF